jgi:hypothetical protein
MVSTFPDYASSDMKSSTFDGCAFCAPRRSVFDPGTGQAQQPWTKWYQQEFAAQNLTSFHKVWNTEARRDEMLEFTGTEDSCAPIPL